MALRISMKNGKNKTDCEIIFGVKTLLELKTLKPKMERIQRR